MSIYPFAGIGVLVNDNGKFTCVTGPGSQDASCMAPMSIYRRAPTW